MQGERRRKQNNFNGKKITRREQSLRPDVSMGGLRFIVFQPGWDTRSQCFTLRRKMAFRLAQSQSLMTVQRAWYPSTHIVPPSPPPLLAPPRPFSSPERPSHSCTPYHTCFPLTSGTSLSRKWDRRRTIENRPDPVVAFLIFTCNFARLRLLSVKKNAGKFMART